MKENLKKTWVYFLGMVMLVIFSYIIFVANYATNAKSQTPQTASSLEQSQFETKPVVQNIEVAKTAAKSSALTTQTVTTPIASLTSETAAVAVPIVPDIKTFTIAIDGFGKYKVELADGMNSFDALLLAGKQNNFTVQYKDYDWGVMVTAIGNRPAAGNQYWALYVNGNYSQVGAKDVIVKENDQINWRYETW